MTRRGQPITAAEMDRVRKLWRRGTPSRVKLAAAAADMRRTVSSLKNMAHFLGVSARRKTGAKPGAAKPPPPTIARRCLRCAESFQSEGAHHRICDRCKASEDWKSGTDYELGSPS